MHSKLHKFDLWLLLGGKTSTIHECDGKRFEMEMIISLNSLTGNAKFFGDRKIMKMDFNLIIQFDCAEGH